MIDDSSTVCGMSQGTCGPHSTMGLRVSVISLPLESYFLRVSPNVRHDHFQLISTRSCSCRERAMFTCLLKRRVPIKVENVIRNVRDIYT